MIIELELDIYDMEREPSSTYLVYDVEREPSSINRIPNSTKSINEISDRYIPFLHSICQEVFVLHRISTKKTGMPGDGEQKAVDTTYRKSEIHIDISKLSI